MLNKFCGIDDVKHYMNFLFEDLDPTSACDRAIGFKVGTGASVITVILVLLQ